MLIGEKKIERPFRWGMIGGGRTANVGPKHRRGALYDNTAFKLVCGAFDIDPVRNIEFGMNPASNLHNVLISYTGCYAINGRAAHIEFLR